MTINFSFDIKNFKGQILGKSDDFISQILTSGNDEQFLKRFLLAKKITEEKSFDIDSVDLKIIKTAIEKDKSLIDLVRAQLILEIEKQEK